MESGPGLIAGGSQPHGVVGTVIPTLFTLTMTMMLVTSRLAFAGAAGFAGAARAAVVVVADPLETGARGPLGTWIEVSFEWFCVVIGLG